jgi:hypothetical protein
MNNQTQGDTMNASAPRVSDYRSRVRTNTRQLAGWTAAWVGTCALMAFGPKFLWNRTMVFTLLAIGLNICVGIGMIVANKKYLMEQDELQRKIMLNAMGITLGVGLIAGVPYSVMSLYHVIPFSADIGHLLMIMGLTYAASNVYGQRRYR